MSKYIGQYNSITSLTGTDLFLVQSGLTYYKLTFSDLEANLDTLPSQTGNNGKYLTTDGTTASWATVSGGTWGSITGTLTAQTDLTTYLSTNYQPLDADLTAISAISGTSGFLKTNGSGSWTVDSNTYITSESDPVFTASDAFNITSASTSAWNAAYGWGDHSTAGYSLTSHNHSINSLSNVVITGTPTDGQALVWDTSTSKWINETVVQDLSSYLTSASAASIYQPIGSYLTSESDTLETVTDRGATSTNAITISNTTESTSATTGALIVSGGVGVAKDLWIDGNLHVAGTTTTENTKTVATHDNLIYLNAALDSTITNAVFSSGSITYTAENLYTAGMDIRITGVDPAGFNIATGDNLTVASATPTSFIVIKANPGSSYVSGGTAHAKEEANPDLGFAGGYYDAGYAHAGLFRDSSDGTFKFFDGYTPEPDEAVNIDTGHVSFSLADISASNAYFSGSVSGTWNGSVIPTTKGGTGLTSLGSAGYILAVNGTATGLEWVEGGGSGAGTVVSTTPPASPEEGMGWFDNGTGKLYIYDGTFWVEATSSLNDEAVMDIVSTMFSSGSHSNIEILYTDVNNAISFNVLSEPITDFLTLNESITGTPVGNAGIIVNRGDLTDVAIRFNETEDEWEFTNDGTEYQSIGSGGGAVSTNTALSNSFWLGA
jgi:hypothetical protein